ncbi:putative beta-glycosyltransferase Glycosyltransferase family 2 [Flavobacterium daejeonense]|nr:putative beta-glycosyltransferase Glycosyltransferase family 2 [Flavobacterium daejeonense]
MKSILSIIIPVYNRATLVGDMLDSVLAQTCGDWECIIIDDGSVDNTADVVKSYVDLDKRFKFYCRPDIYSQGGSGARNYGFKMSCGEFVNFIDSDDVLHKDFVNEKLSAIMKSNSELIVSKTIHTTMDVNEIISYENRTELSDNLLDDFIVLKVSWYVVDPIWRRSFLEGKKLFDEDLLKGQDRDFHIRMLLFNPKIQILDKYLYYYRNNPDSVSALLSEKIGLSMLISGIKRNRLLESRGIANETKFFLFRQLIKIYPSVFKVNNILKLYVEIFNSLFVFNCKNVFYSLKFIGAVLSFNLFGKGQRLLK